jgi:hypothetical protein
MDAGRYKVALHPSEVPLEYTQRFESLSNLVGESTLLTEAQVERSFRKLLNDEGLDVGTFEKADDLLDDLRPESPLRHRLGAELDELRELHTAD